MKTSKIRHKRSSKMPSPHVTLKILTLAIANYINTLPDPQKSEMLRMLGELCEHIIPEVRNQHFSEPEVDEGQRVWYIQFMSNGLLGIKASGSGDMQAALRPILAKINSIEAELSRNLNVKIVPEVKIVADDNSCSGSTGAMSQGSIHLFSLEGTDELCERDSPEGSANGVLGPRGLNAVINAGNVPDNDLSSGSAGTRSSSNSSNNVEDPQSEVISGQEDDLYERYTPDGRTVGDIGPRSLNTPPNTPEVLEIRTNIADGAE